MASLITLIPNSGIQFWQVDLDLERLPRLARSFWEEKISEQPDENGQAPVVLRELTEDQNGSLIDPVSGQFPPADQTYVIGRNQAFDVHMNRWVPLPYFLLMARGQTGQEIYDRGPSNWVRARLTEHPDRGPGRSHRLTLAFDTALLARVPTEPYLALSPENSERQQELVFVPGSDANSWFLDEVWIGDWLFEMLVELRTDQLRGRRPTVDDMPNACEHYARYIVFLLLLDAAEVMPRVRLLAAVSAEDGNTPVAVDLVLDIGNARTCGILIEEHPGQGLNLSDSYPLALRDLSRPELVHGRPFDSRVEFARASFGREAVSRRSGRSSAFSWPSPVRVGPEAVRLAAARSGNEGTSGLSSPKRYLWDQRPSSQGWRFNGRSSDGLSTDPPVSGPFMALVSEDGTVPRQPGTGNPATKSRFSRSSMFTFMLTEIILQALNQMNAPGNRREQKDAERPRRLRSLLMTMPPGMPVAEQKILRARADAAVRLAWTALGLTGRQQEPAVKADLDEATATQIVWLHNEVSERLQGDAGGLMEMIGRVRPGSGATPSLRIASIDIGGGTTDLMVTTYTLQGQAILPKQEFRESFKIAGDDVLERIITAIVIPAMATALEQSGIADPKALLSRALGQDQGGQSEQERHLRRLFVSMVLEPVGLAVLGAYEQVQTRQAGDVLRADIGTILGRELKVAERALKYLETAAAAAGTRDFRVADVVVAAETRQVERVIAAILGPVLADLCEVVWTYDCDVLLLSGRPSRLRVVTDIVLAKTPVPPHRLIGMHRYRVGEKYPFRDAANRIEDPKTTAAVGAALCVQAEGRLRNFTLRTRNLTMRSTARIIGTMDNNGQIRLSNELLHDADLDGPPKPDTGFEVSFEATTQIGFRQLPIERWVATPLYVLEFANPDNAAKFELPLKVKIRRRDSDPDADPGQVAREDFSVDEVEDNSGDRQNARVVSLRLQTIDDQDGYWRDTGRLSIV